MKIHKKRSRQADMVNVEKLEELEMKYKTFEQEF